MITLCKKNNQINQSINGSIENIKNKTKQNKNQIFFSLFIESITNNF